jgi:hypothetical protein
MRCGPVSVPLRPVRPLFCPGSSFGGIGALLFAIRADSLDLDLFLKRDLKPTDQVADDVHRRVRALVVLRCDKDPDTALVVGLPSPPPPSHQPRGRRLGDTGAAASSANAIYRALSEIVSACCVGASDALRAPSIGASSRSRAVISRSGQRYG